MENFDYTHMKKLAQLPFHLYVLGIEDWSWKAPEPIKWALVIHDRWLGVYIGSQELWYRFLYSHSIFLQHRAALFPYYITPWRYVLPARLNMTDFIICWLEKYVQKCNSFGIAGAVLEFCYCNQNGLIKKYIRYHW